MVEDASPRQLRRLPCVSGAGPARLLFVALFALLLPACSTFQLGRPDTGIEDAHGQAVRSAVAESAVDLESAERVRVADLLLHAEREHGLDAFLVMALIEHESQWQPNAVGSSGSVGLLQVQPRTGAAVAEQLGIRWSGASTLRDPVLNVRIGIAYLAELHERFGRTTRLTLAAYNVGPARVDEMLARGLQPRSVYSESVLRREARLRAAALHPARLAGL